MKGFKPTGYGPSAGFKFPTKFGFTGSSGAYTNVQPYVRRKAFADGGFVRQDNPRMKSEDVGDSGSALQRRSRPTTQLDAESGGRSALRPGFKRGGKTKMRKADGGRIGLGALGAGAMSDRERRMIDQAAPNRTMSPREIQEMLRKAMPKKPMAPASTTKEKFAADGGRAYGSSSKGLWSDVKKTGEFIGQIPRMVTDSMKGSMRRTQQDVSDTKRRRIDRVIAGDANYARGGKVYAKGGMARSDEAQDRKMIGAALRKHVSTPAPKGHKGLGALCKADGGKIEPKTMEYRMTPEESKMTPAERRAAIMKKAQTMPYRMSPDDARKTPAERLRALIKPL